MGSPSEAAAVVELARSRPASLGAGRLICVDGPSGSGKTTLAGEIVRLEPSAALVHMDDLFEGWDGLPRVDAQLDGLLRPLGGGRPGTYRRYDWVAGAYAETVTVAPAPLVVLEGVGSGSLGVADLVTVLVWVEAAHDVRMARGLARDGDAFAPYWEAWAVGEQAHFDRHGTRDRVDLVVRT
ncbi:4-amino-4-deoxy-L-arabinose transferase [Nocardioides sp. Root1257]|uniref:uridine kinase family protein n=1 Tax=unclassified Nocardioides TaxID=2615069 RepID=UPI0006FD0470|nr:MULTISPECIES: 4-amino-4-deoxy-L-arabinose transferase [unclassified Nocardioides]KQW43105.1 4-amino-4-deoxy-L-arabinose transferase [Nocardioides sp. Root1257]KRC41973.1 4-amino-4-deoxy-L-arabinose transferase [Nocardioides sp. Root224]